MMVVKSLRCFTVYTDTQQCHWCVTHMLHTPRSAAFALVANACVPLLCAASVILFSAIFSITAFFLKFAFYVPQDVQMTGFTVWRHGSITIIFLRQQFNETEVCVHSTEYKDCSTPHCQARASHMPSTCQAHAKHGTNQFRILT